MIGLGGWSLLYFANALTTNGLLFVDDIWMKRDLSMRMSDRDADDHSRTVMAPAANYSWSVEHTYILGAIRCAHVFDIVSL